MTIIEALGFAAIILFVGGALAVPLILMCKLRSGWLCFAGCSVYLTALLTFGIWLSA